MCLGQDIEYASDHKNIIELAIPTQKVLIRIYNWSKFSQSINMFLVYFYTTAFPCLSLFAQILGQSYDGPSVSEVALKKYW